MRARNLHVLLLAGIYLNLVPEMFSIPLAPRPAGRDAPVKKDYKYFMHLLGNTPARAVLFSPTKHMSKTKKTTHKVHSKRPKTSKKISISSSTSSTSSSSVIGSSSSPAVNITVPHIEASTVKTTKKTVEEKKKFDMSMFFLEAKKKQTTTKKPTVTTTTATTATTATNATTLEKSSTKASKKKNHIIPAQFLNEGKKKKSTTKRTTKKTTTTATTATTDKGVSKKSIITVNVAKLLKNQDGKFLYNPFAAGGGRNLHHQQTTAKSRVYVDNRKKLYDPDLKKATVCIGSTIPYGDQKVVNWVDRHVFKKKQQRRIFYMDLRRDMYAMSHAELCHTKQMTNWVEYQECSIRRNQRLEAFVPQYPTQHAIKE